MLGRDSLEERLAALEQRVVALEAENSELRAQVAGSADSVVQGAPTAQTAVISRRKALMGLGGVAAAGVAAGALAANVQTAHAADGGNFTLGTANTATSITKLSNTSGQNTATVLEIDSSVVSNNVTNGARSIGVTGPIGGDGIDITAPDDATNHVAAVALFASNTDQAKTGAGAGIGVFGLSGGGWGILGQADSGIGVAGAANTGVDLHASGTGRIAQVAAINHAGPPVGADGSFATGEFIRDSKDMAWFSVLDGGNALRWARPGLVNGNTSGGALNLLASPVRVIGNNGTGHPPGASLGAGSVKTFGLAGSNGIPADATAVFGNATVLAPVASPGFVTLTAKGGTATTNTLNFTQSDVTISNFCVVRLSGGALDVHVSGNGPVKFIFDCVGYCL